VLHIHIYGISSIRVNDLTLILLTWRKWRIPNNASKWQMGFNSVFKGLMPKNEARHPRGRRRSGKHV